MSVISKWFPHPSLDTYPSLLISAYDYADGSGDDGWLRKNYPGLRKWAELMTEPNADGSPLLEFRVSGNYGSWTERLTLRPANWWDAVGFGHQDAYSNALGYRALRGMAALADRVGEKADALKYRQRARRDSRRLRCDISRSRDGRSGRLEERRWPTARLLLSPS